MHHACLINQQDLNQSISCLKFCFVTSTIYKHLHRALNASPVTCCQDTFTNFCNRRLIFLFLSASDIRSKLSTFSCDLQNKSLILICAAADHMSYYVFSHQKHLISQPNRRKM